MADDKPATTQVPLTAVGEEFALLAEHWRNRALARAMEVDTQRAQLAAVTAERDALKPTDKVN